MLNMVKKKRKSVQMRKPCISNWISPEERMEHYDDYEIGTEKSVPRKIRYNKFKIIVPTKWDKEQLQAAFEYLHDNKLIDTDFLAVNAIVHAYEEPPEVSHNPIIVNKELYNQIP